MTNCPSRWRLVGKPARDRSPRMAPAQGPPTGARSDSQPRTRFHPRAFRGITILVGRDPAGSPLRRSGSQTERPCCGPPCASNQRPWGSIVECIAYACYRRTTAAGPFLSKPRGGRGVGACRSHRYLEIVLTCPARPPRISRSSRSALRDIVHTARRRPLGPPVRRRRGYHPFAPAGIRLPGLVLARRQGHDVKTRSDAIRSQPCGFGAEAVRAVAAPSTGRIIARAWPASTTGFVAALDLLAVSVPRSALPSHARFRS